MQAAHREHACAVAGTLGRWMRNVMQGGLFGGPDGVGDGMTT